MSTKRQLPELTDVRPKLTVIGVGGAGCNAVNNMIEAGLAGVTFVVANTDAQSLAASNAEHKLQLGATLTEGLGAGSKPEIGEAAAEEALEEIRQQVAGSHMVFVAAGMGGGTGTGAAGVIARIAKELGILTVGVVTKPFLFEGARRMRIAEAGVGELKKYVDTLIVIPNQNLFRLASEKTTFADAFLMADQVLYSGVACIVDLIIKDGLINLDFADVRTIMSGMGTAMMGQGEATGEGRAVRAAEEALSNPLLDDVSLRGAKGLLLSITGGPNLTLYEVDEAATRVRQEVDPEANVIVGATFDHELVDSVRVSIVASGMRRTSEPERPAFNPLEIGARNVQPSRGFGAPVEPGAQEPRFEPAHRDEEVQRRLSAALQYGYGANTQVPGGSQHPMQPAPNDPQSRRARETWRAPGNVRIEEGPPQLSTGGHMPPPLPPGYGDAHSNPDRFTPAPAAEIRRAPRRMPEVDDFPPVGRRAYRAMMDWAGDEGDRSGAFEQDQQHEAPRRRGLFERITGRLRRDSDLAAREQVRGTLHGPDPDEDPGERASSHPFEGAARRTAGHQNSTEDPEMPVFFSRERK